MKKNYFLTLVITLLMAVTASAADSLVGIYKLSNLTDEQKSELGSINADAAFRILPGDADADYYVSGVAGYGCKFPATYDEAAGTLTAIDPSPYGTAFNIMLLYASDIGIVNIDDTSVTFNVKDNGVLEIASEIIVVNLYTGEVYGTYIPEITLSKDETPAIPISDVTGKYIFTGTNIYAVDEKAEYSMSIERGEDSALTINGFMDIDGIQAVYIPETSMIQIVTQQIGDVTIAQMMGDIYFTVSKGELQLITPAVAEIEVNGSPMPLASLTEGKAVKDGSDIDAIEATTAASTANVHVRNGAIYVDGAASVQVYNAAGVQVYADAAVNGSITLPRGIYFVKVGNAKAVSVAL